MIQPWYDTGNKIETLIPGEQSVVFPGAPTGWVVPGDPHVPSTLAPTQYHNFSPRLGIAYSPSVDSGFLAKITGGPGKMSLRAGFGMFYTLDRRPFAVPGNRAIRVRTFLREPGASGFRNAVHRSRIRRQRRPALPVRISSEGRKRKESGHHVQLGWRAADFRRARVPQYERDAVLGRLRSLDPAADRIERGVERELRRHARAIT